MITRSTLTYEQFLGDYLHAKSPPGRLGQYFCNIYIKDSWPELFYETDQTKCKALIQDWLIRHHYWPYMPLTLKEREEAQNGN